jgi:hypothetical protein
MSARIDFELKGLDFPQIKDPPGTPQDFASGVNERLALLSTVENKTCQKENWYELSAAKGFCERVSSLLCFKVEQLIRPFLAHVLLPDSEEPPLRRLTDSV